MPRINLAAIDLLARHFNSHKKGLPEWLKNSSVAYVRADVPHNSRHVIINYQRDSEPSYVECIDFVGISGDEIEDNFLEWAKPDAAARGLEGDQVEGGQGNGGKAYLRQMFAKGYFTSIYDSKLSVVTFTDEKKHNLDFVPSHENGKDFSGDNPLLPRLRSDAAAWLKAFGLRANHNITIVRGIGPSKPVDVERLLDEIRQAPQARNTLRTCVVQFFIDRRNPRALEIVEPPLHPEFPKPVVVTVPGLLNYGGLEVATSKSPAYPAGELRLMISAKPLHGQALASWNRIDFRGSGVSVIGFKEAAELPLNFRQYSNQLYGYCSLPLLTDPTDNYELQGRGSLNEGPLSKALYQFIASEADKLLGKLAQSIESTTAGRKRKNLERLNAKLASWIESKLIAAGGLSETGPGDGGGKPRRKKREPSEHAPPATIKIHREQLDICLGVNSYELRTVAYDAAGRPVPPGRVTWKSNDSAIVEVDAQHGRVEPRSVGVSTVVARTDSGLVSMPLLVQVIEAAQIKIKTSSPAKLGSNRRLPITVAVTTASGQTFKNPALQWRTGNRFIVSVGQDGVAVGGEIGDTEVSAIAGPLASNVLQVEVDRGAGGKPRGGGQGRPQILLSDQDPCPFDHSRVVLNETDPPVFQRAYKPDYDSNVFWINLQHPLANELLKAGEESVRWRTYHFERVVDVFVMIEVRRKFGDSETLDVDQLLDEINVVKTEIYSQAKLELFDLLYDETIDLAKVML